MDELDFLFNEKGLMKDLFEYYIPLPEFFFKGLKWNQKLRVYDVTVDQMQIEKFGYLNRMYWLTVLEGGYDFTSGKNIRRSDSHRDKFYTMIGASFRIK
jgi:hypothetical protein